MRCVYEPNNSSQSNSRTTIAPSAPALDVDREKRHKCASTNAMSTETERGTFAVKAGLAQVRFHSFVSARSRARRSLASSREVVARASLGRRHRVTSRERCARERRANARDGR